MAEMNLARCFCTTHRLHSPVHESESQVIKSELGEILLEQLLEQLTHQEAGQCLLITGVQSEASPSRRLSKLTELSSASEVNCALEVDRGRLGKPNTEAAFDL